MTELSWVEVDARRLAANIEGFRRLVGPEVLLAPTVKANAYGHGIVQAAQAFVRGGADWLCVNALYEARAVRSALPEVPLYLLGPLPADRPSADEALALGCAVVVHQTGQLEPLAAAATEAVPARIHLKIETGTHRLGLPPSEAVALARRAAQLPNVVVEGACSHFADVEDTTDHAFARAQREVFEGFTAALAAAGIPLPIRHFSNTAATLLWPESHYDLVRLGIGAYGMWPSKETLVTAAMEGRRDAVDLSPALTWKTRISQVSPARAGEYVGYGRTYRCTHDSRLAVVPVGYYDGYDRRLSNTAHMLIGGRRAPVRGRVCMNMTIVDVSHIPNAAPGDEVVLLGDQGEESIPADQLAQWTGTINYEVTTRIREGLPRIVTP